MLDELRKKMERGGSGGNKGKRIVHRGIVHGGSGGKGKGNGKCIPVDHSNAEVAADVKTEAKAEATDVASSSESSESSDDDELPPRPKRTAEERAIDDALMPPPKSRPIWRRSVMTQTDLCGPLMDELNKR